MSTMTLSTQRGETPQQIPSEQDPRARGRRRAMRPSYCTQNDGRCATCSLVNYGLDCVNNPIPHKVPQTRHTRMMATYKGFSGPRTVEAVLAQIPEDLQGRLTGRELGMVMTAVNTAYHNGRASHQGIDICDDCVWLPWRGTKGEGQLIPIAALRAIQITDNHYTLDYTES